MRIGVVVPTYDQYGNAEAIFRLFREAETLGFHSVWLGDHIVVPTYAAKYTDPHWFEAMTCAIAGIGMTTKLSFGTDVLVAPYRNPVLLAKMAATAVELSGGRIMLGMGVGFIKGEFAAVGAPPIARRGAVTDEYLKVMRTLFESDGAVSSHGEWINFDDIHFGPRPSAPPPLLVGGNRDRAHVRAALFGDGWHPLFPSPNDYARGRSRIAEIREEAAVNRRFTYSYSAGRTRVLAPRETAPPIVTRDGDIPEDYSYAPPPDVTADGRPRLVGTAAQLSEDIGELAEAGVEQLIVRFAMPWDPEINLDRHIEQMQRFAADVLPICAGL